MNDMNIACFIALSTSRSLSSTMTMLNLSRGAVLQNIHHLENDLGLVLFHSTAPTVRLTDAGERFYDYFKCFEENLIRSAAELTATDAGCQVQEFHLAISEYTGCPPGVLAGLRAYCAEYPSPAPVIAYETPELCSRLLTEGKADLVITAGADLPNSYGQALPLGELPLRLWLAADADLQRLPLCTCPGQEAQTEDLIPLLQDALSLTPEVRVCQNTDSLLLQLRLGRGMAVSPNSGLFGRVPGLTAIPIDRTVPLYLVTAASASFRNTELLLRFLTQEGRATDEL